jgi:hypothetical protein
VAVEAVAVVVEKEEEGVVDAAEAVAVEAVLVVAAGAT